jgi:hypothetical protein
MRFNRQVVRRGAAIVAAQKKGFPFAAAVIVALAVSSAALAGGGVVGTYTTTISSPSELKGRWVLTLAKGGTYKVALNGKALARGRYSATATTITLREPGDTGCGGSGTYAWKRSGKTMRFVRKRESPACQARAAVFAHRFTQVH